MPSTLTWVDHDAQARDRSLRILSLFKEKDTRDELGLGSIRDSLADQLFPGTSTIQTRLRYFLFVPWVYQQLEGTKVPAFEFAARARRQELALVGPLLEGDDQAGVFGKDAGGQLKRLPSSVYWAGLSSWGIRRFDLSQEQYHRSVDALYRARAKQGTHRTEGSDGPETATWHPRLPKPPQGFPAQLDFRLDREEAEFLRDRMAMAHPKSLLAHLALNGRPAEADFAWTHPDLATFPPAIRELLDHAQRFSEVMAGAAILYNLLLAELDGDPDGLVEEHRLGLTDWVSEINTDALSTWDLGRFWGLVLDQGHRITPATRTFVESWVRAVRQVRLSLADDVQVRDLVRRREMVLKKARSRFTNRQARLQWNGYAGMGRMAFRWPGARLLLNDLYAGLGSD
jgi:hypothetical protein